MPFLELNLLTVDLHFITVFFLILEYIYLNVSTSYQNLWKKTYEALNFINQKYNLESFDYILKVGKHIFSKLPTYFFQILIEN